MKEENRDKMHFYEDQFASEFDAYMNRYDLNKRMGVVFNELLPEDISDKKLLDAGCGTGWFSAEAVKRNADVYAMDLGENLLKKTAEKCDARLVKGSVLEIPFEDETFDIVISSEVIEHVPDPLKAVTEMHRVLKPGGILVLTTPNRVWYFSVLIANKLGLRRYQGLENWLSPGTLKKHFRELDFEVEKYVGIHLFPFVLDFLNPVLDFFHRFNSFLAPLMLNMAFRCKK